MKLNNKGFTFVEILAVIVLIGVLSSLAIVGVTRYKDKARDADYEALAKSSYNAMEEYMMTHPYSKTVSLEELEDGSFISNRKDPATKDSNCTGSVEVAKSTGTGGKLDDGSFVVYLCCTNYKKKYTYPGGTVENYTGTDKCSAEAEPEPDVPTPPTPPPGETTYTITYVLNGGSVSGNPSKYSASMLPLTLKQPSRNGYTFTGWTGSNGSTPQKTVTLPKGTTGNKTYTANWRQVNTTSYCSVTLTASGATSSGTKSVRVKVGATKLPSITPPRKIATIKYVNNVGATVKGGERSKNYPLSGWFTKPTSGSKVASNATTPILQSAVSGYTTTKGTWSRKGSATLYSQWGTASVTLPTITKAGATCKWRSSDGSLYASGGNAKLTGANTITFTATCTNSNYTVTLDGNGATTPGTRTVRVSLGITSLPKITIPRKVVKITYTNTTGATQSGGDSSKAYVFEGWYTKASGGSKVASNGATPVLQKKINGYTDSKGAWIRTSGATLYAQWGNVTVKLPTITKLGNTCTWTANNGASTVPSGGSWSFTGATSRTFVAKCVPKQVVVTFDCNGGKITGTNNATANQTYKVGDSNKFNKTCTHPDANKKQDGWKFAEDKDKRYETANGINDAWIEKYSPKVTLKAHWVSSGKPTCSLKITNNPPSGGNGWYRGNVKIDMTTTGVVDVKGLDVTANSTNGKVSYTVTQQGTVTVYGYVKNSSGSDTCQKTVKIDSTPPTCGTASGSSNVWKKGSRTVTLECKDSHSGCVRNTYVNSYSNTATSASVAIGDNAGNTKTCTYNVYIDNTPPNCGTASGSSNAWTGSDRTVRQACTDANSGCLKTTFDKTYTTTTRNGSVEIRDKVGNTKTCTYPVNVDKTPPSCGTAHGASTSWAKHRTVRQACSDSESGCTHTTFDKNYTSTTTTGNVVIRDKVGNARTCSYNVYVDSTPPSCGSPSGGSTSWIKGSRTVHVGCGDAHSGCTQGTFSATSSYPGRTTLSITIRDKVGNARSCTNAYYINVDNTPPVCGNPVGGSTDWSHASSRSVGRYCSDSHSGCAANPQYVGVTNECKTKSVSVVIYDKVGNSATCGAYTYNIYLDRTKPEFDKKYEHRTSKSTSGINEWGGYWRDKLSGLQKANKKGSGSHVYYCYGTKSGCSRRCTKDKKHGSNTHKGTVGIAKDYWLRKADIANNFGAGSTKWDLIKMQTERNKGCQSGNYTVRAEYEVCDRADNCLRTAIKHDFD